MIIYTHGGLGDQSVDKCLKKWNFVPPVIRNLHDKKINNYQIKIYRLCTGVRGWSKSQQDRIWKSTKEKRFTLKDNSGELLINKIKILKEQKLSNQKLTISKKKVLRI